MKVLQQSPAMRTKLKYDRKWKINFKDIKKIDVNVINPILKEYGFVLITDLPISQKSKNQVLDLFSQIIFSIGCPVSQSSNLDFFGEVTDKGNNISDHSKRGYESSAELPFHSDRCDLLTLLCLQQALTGGEIKIACSYQAYRTLKKLNPQYTEILSSPIPFDLRDTLSNAGWSSLPVFSIENGVFISRYVRRLAKLVNFVETEF